MLISHLLEWVVYCDRAGTTFETIRRFFHEHQKEILDCAFAALRDGSTPRHAKRAVGDPGPAGARKSS
jgi:hypothetical protein